MVHSKKEPLTGDVRTYTHNNVLRQIESAEFRNGYYVLEFYEKDGKPSTTPTDRTAKFFLSPSGGTLRDSAFQLICYDSRYDTYRGFKPPPPGAAGNPKRGTHQ